MKNASSVVVCTPRSTVQYVIKHCEKENLLKSNRRCSRSKKLTERDERLMLKLVRKNSQISAAVIASELSESINKNIYPETVCRTLHDAGYHARRVRRKPYESSVNRKKRLKYTELYKNRPLSFWYKVIFSDKSIFSVFGWNEWHLVWR